MNQISLEESSPVFSPHFIFIFGCRNDEFIVDEKTGFFPAAASKAESNYSWNEVACETAQKVFDDVSESAAEKLALEVKMIHMLRLWYPLSKNKHTFLQRFTFWQSFTWEVPYVWLLHLSGPCSRMTKLKPPNYDKASLGSKLNLS